MRRAALALVLLAACAHSSFKRPAPTPKAVAPSTTASSVDLAGARHLEYVLLDGSMAVYDADRAWRQVDTVTLPTRAGVRGVAADPAGHALYVSYGGDGRVNGNGSMLRYDLVAKHIVWDRHYGHGIDSMALSTDGSTLYLPDGELAQDGRWYAVAASTGAEEGVIDGPAGAHNTVAGLGGRFVYLGGRDHNELAVFDRAVGRVVRKVGPLKSGVRPFTVNGRETLAFTTATGFLGFQVADLRTGRVLYTESFPGFSYDPAHYAPSAPSHGISLAPDERELYVVDGPNSVVHVFDVAGLPTAAPRPLADIRLAHPLTGTEAGCAYDCARDGWLQHSRDGRFVYVGDSGDVIDTASHAVVGFLPALRDSRKMIEIDWVGGAPVATTTRHGLGRVGAP